MFSLLEGSKKRQDETHSAKQNYLLKDLINLFYGASYFYVCPWIIQLYTLLFIQAFPTKKYFILNHDQHSFKQIKESRRKTRRDNNNAILRKQILGDYAFQIPAFLFSLSLSFDQTYSAFFKRYVCYFLCCWLITFLLKFLATYCCHIVSATKKYFL